MATAFVLTVAILIGLFLFFLHQVRRSPGSSEWGRTSKWNKRIRITLAVVPIVIAGCVFYGTFIEPNRLVTHQVSIDGGGLPKGLRIAVLSDIHAGGWFVQEKKLRLIVEQTNQLQPDLIIILGDYMSGEGWMSHRMYPEMFAAILEGLHAPLGVYSVLGNHDWWWDGRRVRRALEANGIHVLDDEVKQMEFHGQQFSLAGLADLWTRPQHIEQTIARIPEGMPIIALTHNPDIFPHLPQRVNLMLAGHTHGGQVRFPIIGTVIQPSDFGQRYVRGHVYENGHHLFVTTGIGTSILPVRFGVTPEIVLLTIN